MCMISKQIHQHVLLFISCLKMPEKDLKCRRRSFLHSIKQLWATGTAMLLLFFFVADCHIE